MPDDPLRDDVLGPGPEDVLGGTPALLPAAPTEPADDPVVRPAVRASDLDGPTSAVPLDDRPTANLPRIAESAPAPAVQTGLRAILAPWAVFGAVGVVLIAATTAWASWLRGPTSDEDVPFPKFAPLATATSPPPATADLVALPPEPTVEPAPEPAPEPEPDPEPTRRAQERPRATQERAPAARSQPPAPPPASSGDEEPAQEQEQTVPGNAAAGSPETPDGGETATGPAGSGTADDPVDSEEPDTKDRDSDEDDSESESESD